MKRLPWSNGYFIVFLCIMGAIGINGCFNLGGSLGYSNSIFSVVLCAVWGLGLRKIVGGAYWEKIGALLGGSFLFGLLFFGALICGVSLEKNGKVFFSSWPYLLILPIISLAAAPLFGWCMCGLDRMGKRLSKEAKMDGTDTLGKYFMKVFCVFFFAYLVVLLAVWPGFFSYDAETTVYMVFTRKYSAICPRLHVLLLGGCLRGMYFLTGSYNLGIAFYLLVQNIVLSGCFAYMMTFLYRIGIRASIRKIGILFLALCPTVSMFVCCTTKDGIFSGGVALLVTLLLELAHDGEVFWSSRGKRLLFIFASLAICFFRNNGPFAYIPFVVFFLIYYRKYWKKCLLLAGTAVGIFFVATMLMDRIWVFTPSPIAEMCCVPMQQMARVYTEKKEELTSEDTEVLYDLIPEVILDRYRPKLADSVKINFMGDNFKKEPGKFIALWLRLGLRYPFDYVEAFLENTYGYWYPDTVLDGYKDVWIVSRQYGDSSYFQFVTEPPGERHSLIPPLERFYEKISLEIYQQRVPVVSMIFSIGFWHWIYLFLAFYLWLFGKRKSLTALLPVGLLYLTVLLGPIALVRYVVYAFFCVPLVLALLFQRQAF